MSKKKRFFSRSFKMGVVKRIESGESVSALSVELGVKRAVLYRWRDGLRRDGSRAFPGRIGRPPKVAQLQRIADESAMTELERAQRKIVELERKVGQQQLDLDFFKRALRDIEAARRPSSARGATASSPTSGR